VARASTILPAALRDGDVVGVCTPAGRPPADRLRRGLERLRERFEVRLGPVAQAALDGAPTSSPGAPGFLAGSDRARAEELNGLLADPDVRAIFAGRGGYGVSRILPDLDPAPLVADPRPIVGFSDLTALLAWAELHGVRGVHGPVITQLGELPAADVAWLHRVLTDPTPLGALPWPLAGGRAGAPTVSGRLVAGNITLLACLVGTPWEVPLDDAVLLLEEVGEAPYAIDRDLTHLGLARALDRVRAAIVGDLTRCLSTPYTPGAVDDPGPAYAVVAERLANWRIPVLTGVPVGHGERNAAVPFGAPTTVNLADGRVVIESGAVA
jgi:muramoyltetrapeptide carboxypeptidase